MWDVEPEISDLNMALNAMPHLNLLEEVAPPVQPSSTTYNISNPPPSIHDVEIQYVDENMDPLHVM